MSTSCKYRLWANGNNYRQYLAIVLGFPLLLLIILITTICIFEKGIPAPRLSSSDEFNEKARLIRNSSANKCDVLIIGSSMALNNIDGSAIKKMTRGKSVLNLGSAGLSVSESGILLNYVVPLYKPKVIILATYYGDFTDHWEKTIDWKLFRNYIHGKSTVISYLKSIDHRYYLFTYIKKCRSIANKGNTTYPALMFDGTGSLMLDCNNFEIKPHRWDPPNIHNPLPRGRTSENLAGLADIEKIARNTHSHLLVVATPLRKTAEERLSIPEIAQLWEAVSRSVNIAGGTFIRVRSFYDFNDEHFTDFAHLNGCGASKVSDIIAPVILKLLQNPRQ